MKYLVNRETKEHKIIAKSDDYAYDHGGCPEGWQLVEADDEGWIEWRGKSQECPLPADAKVEVVFSYDAKPCWRLPAKDWKWDDVTLSCYRPILPAESKPTLEETWHAIKRDSKVDVFTRLSAAVSASESIPALIAEINAMLPEGYEVREKAETEQIAERASGWKEGDALECALYTVSWWIGGKIYSVRKDDRGLYVTDEDGDKRRLDNIRQCFKFHSRPVTK